MRALCLLSVAGVAIGMIGVPGGAFAQGAGGALFFEGDMVRGNTPDGATGPVCVLTSQFKRGESAVWRVRVLNDKGEPVGEDGLKSLFIEMPGITPVQMGFGWHPRQGKLDQFWAASWRIPNDYPTGTLGYKIVATTLDGQTVTWEPFKIPSSHFTVIEGEVTYTK